MKILENQFAPPYIKPPWYIRFLRPSRRKLNFSKIVFPTIENMPQTLLTSELMSVKPLKENPSKEFYSNFKYIPPKIKWYQFWKKW